MYSCTCRGSVPPPSRPPKHRCFGVIILHETTRKSPYDLPFPPATRTTDGQEPSGAKDIIRNCEYLSQTKVVERYDISTSTEVAKLDPSCSFRILYQISVNFLSPPLDTTFPTHLLHYKFFTCSFFNINRVYVLPYISINYHTLYPKLAGAILFSPTSSAGDSVSLRQHKVCGH